MKAHSLRRDSMRYFLSISFWQELMRSMEMKMPTSIGFERSWRPLAMSFTYRVYFSLPVTKASYVTCEGLDLLLKP